jgi:tetratricopeptide (TPR) repeat protein
VFIVPPPPAPPPLVSKSAGKDARAISDSLRRVRTQSGQLVEAAKQQTDRFNEIIAQAVESMNEEPAPAGAASHSVSLAAPRPDSMPASPISREAGNGGRAADTAGPQTESRPGALQSTAQSVAQTAAQTVAMVTAATQAAARRTSGALAAVAAASSNQSSSSTAVGAPATRSTGSLSSSGPASVANSMGGSGQLPPHGPSSVLVQASGLKPHSFESKFRAGVWVLMVLLFAGTYFILRDILLGAPNSNESERNLVRAEEESDRFIKLGEMDREQGNYDAAIEQFHHALQLTPNNQNARFQLAQTHRATNQLDEALREYIALIRIAPEHLEARLQFAEIHRARGNWSAAYQEFQRLIALDQNSVQAQYALEVIERYQAEHPEADDKSTARNARNRRSQKKATPTLLPSTVARVTPPLFAQRSAAAPNINPPPALAKPPGDDRPDPRELADAHKKLGVRYLNVREYRAAINEFLSALRLTPGDKDLYYFVGSSYNGLNQPALAYDYYRRVDSGPYVGPAQSGARQTEKAAREEFKRRGELKGGGDKSGKPIANSFEE